MGFIIELIWKSSYQRNKINKNIVFIAVCNPYLQAKKN